LSKAPLPAWVDRTLYDAQPVQVLHMNLAVIMAAMSYDNKLAAQAAARGIPMMPPIWTGFENWNALEAKATGDDITMLTNDIFERSLRYEAEERARRDALANCKHSWARTHGVVTKCCRKCGRVEPVIQPKRRKFKAANTA
jgi:hypothetical protein